MTMLNKILTLIIIGLIAVLAAMRWQSEKKDKCIVDLNNRLSVAEKNADTLKKTLEREHNDKIELGKRNEELEAAAKADTSFDWRADIASSDVVKQLRENAIRVSGSRARAD